MRDLFSQCTCMHTYVRVGHAQECQFVVSLGNVNLRSRIHTQKCVTETCIQYSRNLKELEDRVGGTILGDGGQGEQCENKKRTTKSSKVESTYWRVSTRQGGQCSWPFATYVLGGVKAPTKPNSVDNCSACPTHMRNVQRKASYACIFLVIFIVA